MAFIYTALVVADITALKTLTGLTEPKRVDGVFLVVENNGDGDRAWYQYDASASDAEDLPKIVNPNDSIGRWFQFAGGTDEGGGGGVSFGGQTICTGSCAVGGKAFKFYAPQTDLELQVVRGFDITITSGTTNIQLYRWNTEPNTGLTGRQFVAELPHTGGTVTVDIDSTYRWISFFARNPANTNPNAFDGVCFTVNGNVCTLLGFS